MTDKIVVPGAFTDLADPEQLGELNLLLNRILATINVFDPNSFALSWIEGAASGQVIASNGDGNAPVYTGTPTLTGATFSGLTASKVIFTSAAKALTSTGTVGVTQGGTGATSLADNGVLYGNATAAIGATAELATNEVLVGSTGNPPSGSDSPTVANLTATTAIRMSTAIRRRYYHVPLGSENPGASGASWVAADGNTTGGWRITNAAHLLRGDADIHADWDGASDPTVGVKFAVGVDNTAGGVGDTVDLKITCYYKGVGDTATKTQTVEVATVVGQSAQYKQFAVTFPIDWDAAANVLEAGDALSFILNLETDTSEVDNVIITSMEFYYPTTHVGIESGDV